MTKRTVPSKGESNMGQKPEKVVSRLVKRNNTTFSSIDDFADHLAHRYYGTKSVYAVLLTEEVAQGAIVPMYEQSSDSSS